MMTVMVEWRGERIDARVSFLPHPSLYIFASWDVLHSASFLVILGGPFIRLGGGLIVLPIKLQT